MNKLKKQVAKLERQIEEIARRNDKNWSKAMDLLEKQGEQIQTLRLVQRGTDMEIARMRAVIDGHDMEPTPQQDSEFYS